MGKFMSYFMAKFVSNLMAKLMLKMTTNLVANLMTVNGKVEDKLKLMKRCPGRSVKEGVPDHRSRFDLF